MWFLAVVGGAIADRLGFRRALSLAYLILEPFLIFLLGSIGSAWLAPLRDVVPLVGIGRIHSDFSSARRGSGKPPWLNHSSRLQRECSLSRLFHLLHTGQRWQHGGAVAGLVGENHGIVENVFRIAALSVFLMLFVVLLLFKEPRQTDEGERASLAQVGKNFLTVLFRIRDSCCSF